MFPTSIWQRLIGNGLLIWAAGCVAVAHSTGASLTSSSMAIPYVSIIISCMIQGTSWKTWVNRLRPDTFDPPPSTAQTPLGDKETEVELYRCYQELVAASESETNVEALDHFRDGWVSLFNTSHRAKITDSSTPSSVDLTKTAKA